MIVGLSGYARSGKDTIGNRLVEAHGYARLAFADALKDLAARTNPLVADGVRYRDVLRAHGGLEHAKIVPEVRIFLQHLGVACREVFGESVWIGLVERRLERSGDNVVITDVRFPNESALIRRLGGEVWRVERPGCGPTNGHVSETSMDDEPVDALLLNEADFAGLYAQVDRLAARCARS